MSPFEQSLLEALRTLPADKQQEILTHAERLRSEVKPSGPRWNGKGLWVDLHVTLTAAEIDENQREMWKDFPREDL